MRRQFRARLTYANVITTIALFVALGGISYAATQLPKNSVESKQLKANAVTAAKIKNGAVTGAKIQLSSLGTVPSAGKADSATTAARADSAATAGRADSAQTATSATTAANAANADNADNAAKLAGIPANRYLTAVSTLLPGETEVGVFGAAATEGSYDVVALEFQPKLPAEVESEQAEEHAPGSTSEKCPGQRQAAPGYLCIYESFRNGISFDGFGSTFDEGSSAVAAREGAVMIFHGTSDLGNVRGTWAYTAP